MTPKIIWAHPDHWQRGRGGQKIDTIFLHIMAGTLPATDAWFSASCAERTAMNKLGLQAWFKMSPIEREEYVIGLQKRKEVTAPPSSANYGLGLTGETHLYVAESDMAFHTGPVHNPTWKLYNPRLSNNARSIGVEHEGQPDAHGNMAKFMPEAQLAASAALVAGIAQRYSIPLDRDHIVKHSEVDAVNRPFCPPLNFPIDEIILRAKGALDARGSNT